MEASLPKAGEGKVSYLFPLRNNDWHPWSWPLRDWEAQRLLEYSRSSVGSTLLQALKASAQDKTLVS